MAQGHPVSRLGRWEGYEVRDDRIEVRPGRSWCVIGLEPHAYLSAMFARLPHLTTVEEYEALPPWNLETAIASSSRRGD